MKYHSNTQTLLFHLDSIFPHMKIQELLPLSLNRSYVYKAITAREDFLLKILPINSLDRLQREYLAIQTLFREGAPVPRPLKEENNIIQINEVAFMARAYEFVEGHALQINKSNFFSLGTSIGHIHNIWDKMKKPSWLRDITINELLYNSLDAIRNSYNDCESLLLTERLTSTIAVILEKYNDESLFGCSHGDAHHLNAIQTTLGQTVIIDFEDVGWQWRIYDLATAIWGTFGRGGTPEIWKELISGYSSIRFLNQEEEGLIRFLIFARHLWWLGLHAKNWNMWARQYSKNIFSSQGLIC